MVSFGSKRRFSRVAVVAAVGMALVIGCAASGARAADDDDDEDVSLDTKIVRGILKGLGLRRDEGRGIEYRERSPLVLPPAKSLPAPEVNNASKTAGWPDDPDVKQARKKKQAERDRKPYTEGVDDRPLLPDQYKSAGGGPSTPRGGEAPGRSVDETSRPSSQAELGAKGIFSGISSMWAPKEEYTTFSGEPPRSSLIEPPPGYRTPSPNQPYGVGKEKWKPTVVDRAEPVR
jgi:hypothetical protein